MTRVITITSGKGGVGKTSITLNLALAMAAKGFRTAVFDADLGLANINILTGIYPEKHLVDVLEGRCTLDDIIIKNYKGIDIIPGSTGIEKLADLGPRMSRELIKSFLSFSAYDYIFFDTSAGISTQVISFCMASNEVYLVITGQPTSVTDAYSMLKVLSNNRYENPVNIILNQINSAEEARHIYKRLNNTVQKFLSVKLKPAGVVVTDRQVAMAVNAQIPFVMLFPDSRAAKCINTIAKKIRQNKHNEHLSLTLFWERCFSFLPQNHYNDNNYDNYDTAGNCCGAGRNQDIKENGQEKAYERKENSLNKEIEIKLNQIESGFFELADQFRSVKKLIEKNRGNKTKILDFEQWLKNIPIR